MDVRRGLQTLMEIYDKPNNQMVISQTNPPISEDTANDQIMGELTG